jgi:glycosyltransferase involved in cell wall biosynthesis
MKLSFTKKHYEKIRVPLINPYIPHEFYQKNYTINPKEITWIMNSYVHKSIGGSEYMAHIINKYLISQGYTINVIGKWETQTYEGVNLIYIHDDENVKNAIGKCSVFFTQNYNYPEITVKAANILNKRVVIFIHTTFQPYDRSPENYKTLIDPSKIKVIYNSIWVQKFFDSPLRSIIINPPIDKNKLITSSSKKYVTLVSTTYDKGNLQFIEIAKKMPDIQFLGIGSETNFRDVSVKNIEYKVPTKNIEEIYAQTDIILAPSIYESWGMVAGEAIASGIPVIASPTPGLQENLDYAGLFIERDFIDEWVAMIYKLKNDSEFYNKTSEKCKIRAKELKIQNNLQFQDMLTFINS